MGYYLLDTQALIWYFDGNKQLPAPIANAISDISNSVFVSRVSFWEISIKLSLGKLKLSVDLFTLMQHCEQAGFMILGLENEHILALQELPFHHRDPLDRLLVAQCLS
jgi:PIN domain nuclease of toxin-antitoxin system